MCRRTSRRGGSRRAGSWTASRRGTPSTSAQSGATGATRSRSSRSPTARRCGSQGSPARPCPRGGGVTIEKDSRGEPTGLFIEQTYVPLVELSLMAVAPRFTHAERSRALRESMRIYNGTGTTSVVEGHGVAEEVLRAYEALAGRRELTVRAHLLLSPSWGASDPVSMRARLDAWQARIAGRGAGDAFLRVAGLVAGGNPTPDNVVRPPAMSYTGCAGLAHYAPPSRPPLSGLLLV